jgi:hypothetical protein
MTQEKIITKKNKRYKVTQEIKMHSRKRDHIDMNGRPCSYITCPFCLKEIKVDLWSLKVTNKKCNCGVLHTRWGSSIKIIEQTLLERE